MFCYLFLYSRDLIFLSFDYFFIISCAALFLGLELLLRLLFFINFNSEFLLRNIENSFLSINPNFIKNVISTLNSLKIPNIFYHILNIKVENE